MPSHHNKKVVLLDVPVPSDSGFAALNRDQLNFALIKRAQEELVKAEYRNRIHGADELIVTLKEIPRENWRTDQTEHYKTEALRLLQDYNIMPVPLTKLIPPFSIGYEKTLLGPRKIMVFDENPTPRSQLPPITLAKPEDRADDCPYQTWASNLPPRAEAEPRKATTAVYLSPSKLGPVRAEPIMPGTVRSDADTQRLLDMMPPKLPARTQPNLQAGMKPFIAPPRPQSPPLPVSTRTPSLGQRMKDMIVIRTSTQVDNTNRNDAQFSRTLSDTSAIPREAAIPRTSTHINDALRNDAQFSQTLKDASVIPKV